MGAAGGWTIGGWSNSIWMTFVRATRLRTVASIFTADEAPEPGTLALLGGGLAAMCVVRLRRSRRNRT